MIDLDRRVAKAQPEPGAGRSNLGVREELDRAGHHESAFSGGERRDVGPSSGKVEPYRSRGTTGVHGATHQSWTVGSSPRRSIVTPCTRRFIPCSPRA